MHPGKYSLQFVLSLCVVYTVELWTKGGVNPKIDRQIADPSRIGKAHIVSIS